MGHRRSYYSVTLNDAYVDYGKGVKFGSKDRLTLANFKKLFNVYIDSCMDAVTEKAYLLKMPYNLGEVYIEKEYKPMYLDHYASKLARKEVFAYNDHTGGFVYRTVWTKPKRIDNVKFYRTKVMNRYKKFLNKKIMAYSEAGKYLPAFNVIDSRSNADSLRVKQKFERAPKFKR